ncbi:TasA family protein [Methanosarcina sp. WWM596]|uniref:TasA family protein n=1 Tax=Methanosarcina sp. WWM596 TaxID=1434103 RepID=UPI0006156A7A|nr:TasA family protein [Methanosarcina sp. WWM596]AKB17787.1 hypothetical protein MSWHS_0924 [Methanosarcina sp. WWM596]
MFNKKVFMSIFVLGMAVTLAGAGTWAWMTDAGTSSDNTFTSGTLDMQLANNGDDYSDGVTATWVSPANFKPGDRFSAELRFTNVGTVNANHLYFYPELLPSTGSVDLADKIIITSVQGNFIRGSFPRHYSINIAPVVAWVTGNYDGILTLEEFCQNNYVAFSILSDPILRADNQEDFGLLIKGKFSGTAGNEYQGTSCTFNLEALASQNSPTEDYVLINDESTVSGPDMSQDDVDLPDDTETE